jgi:nucleoside-diphosphate-sugar epimerase
MADRVLLTGISGVVGGHVALALLKAGYAVRGSLRDLTRAAEVGTMLRNAGADTAALEFARLDLLDDAGWNQAATGCRYLQHVASPLMVKIPRDREELIRPAVEGTRRALEAGLAAGVERIVITSSVAAIGYGHPSSRIAPYTAADWSSVEGDGVNAYTESKTRAELEAWSIMEAAGRRDDLVAINPSVVLGPLLGPDPGVSSMVIRRLLDGTVPFAPRLAFNIVDVRDVAALHLAAMTDVAAGGHRFIAAAAAVTLLDLAELLRPAFPEYASRLPRYAVPDWLVRLYALFDADARGNVGALGHTRHFDAGPAEVLLRRPFIPARLAAAATAQSLVDFGVVKPQKRG